MVYILMEADPARALTHHPGFKALVYDAFEK